MKNTERHLSSAATVKLGADVIELVESRAQTSFEARAALQIAEAVLEAKCALASLIAFETPAPQLDVSDSQSAT